MEYNKLVSEFRDLMRKEEMLVMEEENTNVHDFTELNALCDVIIKCYKKMLEHDGALIDIDSYLECEDWFRKHICLCGEGLGKCNVCYGD